MQGDLISRSAVLEEVYEMDISDCTDIEDIIYKAYATIAAAPAIDAVPVVRCKDCKWRGGYHCPMFSEELESYDEDSSEWIEYDETVDNGYCERGEKIGR